MHEFIVVWKKDEITHQKQRQIIKPSSCEFDNSASNRLQSIELMHSENNFQRKKQKNLSGSIWTFAKDNRDCLYQRFVKIRHMPFNAHLGCSLCGL